MLNVCNAGLAPMNEVTKNFDTLPNSSYVMNPNTVVTENLAPTAIKKRKFSSQDVPGPSTYYTKSSPKQAPMSEFYHSLLKSSYHDDFNCAWTSWTFPCLPYEFPIEFHFLLLPFDSLQLINLPKRKWLRRQSKCLGWNSCNRKRSNHTPTHTPIQFLFTISLRIGNTQCD